MAPFFLILAGLAPGCTPAADPTSDPAADTATPNGAFSGIEAATWDGADGLSGAWSGGSEGVTLEALDDSGAVVGTVDSQSGAATISGLDEGEYVLRVLDASGDDGGRSIHQWVGDNRLVYRSESAITGGGRAVHGDSTGLVAVGGGYNDEGRVVLYDLSASATPAVLSELTDLGEVSDVEVQGSLMAVATDTTMHPEVTTGVRFYDIADPTVPTLLGSIPATSDNAHTLTFGEEGVIYLASTLNAWEAIYDVSDPSQPTRLGTFSTPAPSSPHDQTWVEGQLWVAYTFGLAVADTADPANLELLGVLPATWPSPFVHNLWPTADGKTLAVSEEAVGGSLRVVDIQDLTAMTIVAEVETEPEHSIHNVVVRDHYAFAAWYTDGLLVFDLSDPENPELAGQVDTWSGNEDVENRNDGSQWPNVNGATHVWPMGPHIVISDSGRGLVVFDFFPKTILWGETWGGNG